MIHEGQAIFILFKKLLQNYFTFKNIEMQKGKPKRIPIAPANARNEKRYVFLEAEVRLLKIDNIDQSSLKKVKKGAEWKLLTVVRYDIEGSYYIEVISIWLICMII